MDPVTHAILGASAGYALFGGKLGRTAAAVGAVAGIAPDIDHFVSSDEDPLRYIEFHRYFTHSLLFSIAGSWICTLPWLARKSFRPHWRVLWACSLIGYLTHVLSDSSTTYGTQIFWPFSRMRVGWDFISIIDPLFTLVLAVGLSFALWKQKQQAIRLALCFAVFYLGLGALQKTRAARVQRKMAAQRGHKVDRSEVMPTLGNQIVWRSVYQSQDKIFSDRIRVGWFSEGTFRPGSSLPLITWKDLTPLEQQGNEASRAFDRFAWFSDHWVARSPGDSTLIGDMRYSLSTDSFDPIWGIRFFRSGDFVRVEWVERSADRKIDLPGLWNELVGKDPDYKKATSLK